VANGKYIFPDYIQTVFAVSNRQSLIKPEFKEDIYKYVTGIVKNQGQKFDPQSKRLGLSADHVHLLID